MGKHRIREKIREHYPNPGADAWCIACQSCVTAELELQVITSTKETGGDTLLDSNEEYIHSNRTHLLAQPCKAAFLDHPCAFAQCRFNPHSVGKVKIVTPQEN